MSMRRSEDIVMTYRLNGSHAKPVIRRRKFRWHQACRPKVWRKWASKIQLTCFGTQQTQVIICSRTDELRIRTEDDCIQITVVDYRRESTLPIFLVWRNIELSRFVVHRLFFGLNKVLVLREKLPNIELAFHVSRCNKLAWNSKESTAIMFNL